MINSPESEDDVLVYLYEKSSKSLKPFILKNSGNVQDAEDIIQNAIIICYEHIKQGKFKLQTSVTGYIYTVGKYMWYKELKKRKKFSLVEQPEYEDLDATLIDFELFSVSKTSLLNELFKELDEGCKTLLIQNIYQKLPMKTIAKMHGLKNEQIARNKKYKCLKKLQNIITKSSRFQSLLKDINL